MELANLVIKQCHLRHTVVDVGYTYGGCTQRKLTSDISVYSIYSSAGLSSLILHL